ncbi:hypothetical protein ACJ7RV_002620 [Vibrio parahaemolyticus]
MAVRLKPNGYIAICQCGKTVGAIDLNLTERKEAGKILGKWIADGCELKPRFAATWRADISPCKCTE